MGKRRVRLKDIAKRAGVSIATVSLVLNDKALKGNVRISDQTVQRVRREALAMGYFSYGMVGLIVPWLWPSVEIPMIQGITEVFRKAHYNLSMGVMSGRDLKVEMEELRAMDNKGFEAVLFEAGFDLMAHPELLRNNYKNWKRVVVINQFPHDDFAYVTIDQEACGYLATRYLQEQGHRHIACAGGHFNVAGADRILKARFQGYDRAMREAGLSPVVFWGEEDTLEIPDHITAIYCCRFRGATNLLGRCIDLGIRVPEKVSIVGMGDDREKTIVRPKVTTLDVRAYEMGVLAAEMVLNLIDGKSVTSKTLAPKLIERDSVRKL